MQYYPTFRLLKYSCVHVTNENLANTVLSLRTTFYAEDDPRNAMYAISTEHIDVFLIYSDNEPIATFAIDRDNILLRKLNLPKMNEETLTSLLYGIRKDFQGLNKSVVFFTFLSKLTRYLGKTGFAGASAPRTAALFLLLTGGEELGVITNYLDTGVDYKYIYSNVSSFYTRHKKLYDQVEMVDEQ